MAETDAGYTQSLMKPRIYFRVIEYIVKTLIFAVEWFSNMLILNSDGLGSSSHVSVGPITKGSSPILQVI